MAGRDELSEKFKPTPRFSICWHNLFKQGFMFSKDNSKWMLARLKKKNENIGS